MVKEVDPRRTERAEAFNSWLKAPMPMVTIFRTLDVTRLVRLGHKNNIKFNALMCWCIGKAASECRDFYLLPVGNRLMHYDKIAVNLVVNTADGRISTCDIPFYENIHEFCREYMRLSEYVHDTGLPYDVSAEYMVIGTSAIAGYEIDGAVNIYTGMYNNPFVVWGRYRKKFFRTMLPVSFQFHHVQMDGVPAAAFLERLQEKINMLKIK